MVDLSKLGKTKKKTQEEMSKIGEPLEDAMDQMLGHQAKTKKKSGRPKKIVMESSSSESEEEKPKKKKVGRPKKVVESSSSESEEEKPKKKPVGRPKKCSCGSGLDIDLKPYQKFYDALKANTAIRPLTS